MSLVTLADGHEIDLSGFFGVLLLKQGTSLVLTYTERGTHKKIDTPISKADVKRLQELAQHSPEVTMINPNVLEYFKG